MSREHKSEAEQLLQSLNIIDYAAFKTQLECAIVASQHALRDKAFEKIKNINPQEDGLFSRANQFRLISLAYVLARDTAIESTGIFETIYKYRQNIHKEASIEDILLTFYLEMDAYLHPRIQAVPTESISTFTETVGAALNAAAQYVAETVNTATQTISNASAEATKAMTAYIKQRFFTHPKLITAETENAFNKTSNYSALKT